MTGDCTINLLFAAYLKILEYADANLPLARIVNYVCKIGCKLKRTFTIVKYGSETFIVQATDEIWNKYNHLKSEGGYSGTNVTRQNAI